MGRYRWVRWSPEEAELFRLRTCSLELVNRSVRVSTNATCMAQVLIGRGLAVRDFLRCSARADIAAAPEARELLNVNMDSQRLAVAEEAWRNRDKPSPSPADDPRHDEHIRRSAAPGRDTAG